MKETMMAVLLFQKMGSKRTATEKAIRLKVRS